MYIYIHIPILTYVYVYRDINYCVNKYTYVYTYTQTNINQPSIRGKNIGPTGVGRKELCDFSLQESQSAEMGFSPKKNAS